MFCKLEDWQRKQFSDNIRGNVNNACEAGNNNPNIKRLIQTRGMEEGGEGRTGDIHLNITNP